MDFNIRNTALTIPESLKNLTSPVLMLEDYAKFQVTLRPLGEYQRFCRTQHPNELGYYCRILPTRHGPNDAQEAHDECPSHWPICTVL